MRPAVADEPPASARVVAEHTVLALNESMMQLYETSLTKFTQNIHDRVPVILALFNGQGGQMILYRPGQPPEVAAPVPIRYQVEKSVGHSSMAIYQILAPYLSDAYANQLWRAPVAMYRTQNQSALECLDALDIPDDARSTLRSVLERNLAFMDGCLAKGGYSYADLEDYTRGTTPLSIKLIGSASGVQVGHWMRVIDDWKKDLGTHWERTYAATNTSHVARRNHILYTILVQFMGTEAMGDRLFLLETPEFETTPEQMLDVLARIVADRSLGMVFFRDLYLMGDVELLGDGARAAIEREMAERGQEAVLPTLAPFRCNDWPWTTDPTKGTGPARLEDAVFGCPVRPEPDH
ncbi:hypothetical protein [Mycobacterium sp.]|uniref:hypothetical protein n=1 Tax=Mycobacterium sp. TaxID=1785 RepID=UPI002C15E477|nr:hypothetical protein [Mycobacterium sp.]HTQ22007.1 hypothetical protein [Mycobacterium sp.]